MWFGQAFVRSVVAEADGGATHELPVLIQSPCAIEAIEIDGVALLQWPPAGSTNGSFSKSDSDSIVFDVVWCGVV